MSPRIALLLLPATLCAQTAPKRMLHNRTDGPYANMAEPVKPLIGPKQLGDAI